MPKRFHALEHEGPGEDDVDALGVEVGELRGGAGATGLHHRVYHGVHRLAGEHAAVERAQRLLAGEAARQAQHLLDRARRAHRHVEAVVAHGPVERGEHALDVASTRVDRRRVQRVGGEEPVREAHGAELEAGRGQDLAALAHQQLGGPAADVAQQQPLVEDLQRL